MAKESYDRTKEVKQSEDSKFGVKGLVDSGITSIPRFFIHPPETLSDLKRPNSTTRPDRDIIPTIDLSSVDSDLLRRTIVEKVARASRGLGFFQVVNHGIGFDVLERVIGAIKGFHEQPAEFKAVLYRRDLNGRVSFISHTEIVPGWRDSIRTMFGPTTLDFDEIPEIFRNEALEWNQHATKLGEVLMGLMCISNLNFDLISIFQIMSNDEYRSGVHRVLANPSQEPRISAGVFFSPSDRDSLFGPFTGLISLKNPARFRHLTFTEYRRKLLLDCVSECNCFE